MANDVFVARLDASGAFVWAARGGVPAVAPSFYGAPSRGLGIGLDATGNSYVAGEIDMAYFGAPATATASFGTLSDTVAQGVNLFVTKVGAGGTFTWLKLWTASSNIPPQVAIAVDSAGDSYLTGRAGSSPGSKTFPVVGDPRAYVLKLNPAGVFQWVAAPTLGGPTGWAKVEGQGIALGTSGVSYMAGTITSSPSGGSATFGIKTLTPPPTFFIAKVSSAGTF